MICEVIKHLTHTVFWRNFTQVPNFYESLSNYTYNFPDPDGPPGSGGGCGGLRLLPCGREVGARARWSPSCVLRGETGKPVGTRGGRGGGPRPLGPLLTGRPCPRPAGLTPAPGACGLPAAVARRSRPGEGLKHRQGIGGDSAGRGVDHSARLVGGSPGIKVLKPGLLLLRLLLLLLNRLPCPGAAADGGAGENSGCG